MEDTVYRPSRKPDLIIDILPEIGEHYYFWWGDTCYFASNHSILYPCNIDSLTFKFMSTWELIRFLKPEDKIVVKEAYLTWLLERSIR